MRAGWRVDRARLDAFLRCVGGVPGAPMPAAFAPAAWQAFPADPAPPSAWLAGLDVRLTRPVDAGERLLCTLDPAAARPLPGGVLRTYRLNGWGDGAGGAFSCRIDLWTGPGGAAARGPQRDLPPAGEALPVWTGRAEPGTIAAYAGATGDAGPLHDRFAHGTWIGAVLEQHLLRWAGGGACMRRLHLRLLAPLPVGAALCWRPRLTGAGDAAEVAAVAADGAGRRVARARCRVVWRTGRAR